MKCKNTRNPLLTSDTIFQDCNLPDIPIDLHNNYARTCNITWHKYSLARKKTIDHHCFVQCRLFNWLDDYV